MNQKHNFTTALVGGASSAQEGTATIKDDLYLGVNGDWLKTAKIPADRSTAGGFADLVINNEKTLMRDFGEMLDGSVEPNNVLLANFVKYYRLAADFEARDKAGFNPLKPLIESIQKLTGYSDLQLHLTDLYKKRMGDLLPATVMPDMKATSHNALYMFAAPLILPDTTYYAEDNQNGADLIAVFRSMMLKLLKSVGFADTQATEIVDEAIALDAKMAAHENSNEENADILKMYNPESFEQFDKHSSSFNLKAYVEEIVNKQVDQLIVCDTKYYCALDEIFTPDNFSEVKSWLIVQTLQYWSAFLSDDARVTAGEFNRQLNGQKEARSKQKSAYYLAYDRFNMVVGDYYARKYFSRKAKADVTSMVHRMIDVYKNRLSQNTWLSDKTRQKAILKLNTLIPNVGFPDKIATIFAEYVVDDDKSFFDNALRFSQLEIQDVFDKISRPIDRTMWNDMDPAMVNAYYSPLSNIIVFPAGILQKPFYSLKQNSSENFGGIGAVMAHEISHAFDNNGANFDEYGNLHNWWSDEDLKQFKKLTQAMINEFDGLEIVGVKLNGKLTVSENVADQGGLSCALAAAKEDTNFSDRDFFENWARVWCEKASTEFLKTNVSTDVHAPGKLRANVQAQNLDDFYTTFDVHEGDGMWLAPEKRVHIW